MNDIRMDINADFYESKTIHTFRNKIVRNWIKNSPKNEYTIQ